MVAGLWCAYQVTSKTYSVCFHNVVLLKKAELSYKFSIVKRVDLSLWQQLLAELKRLRGSNELRARQLSVQAQGKIFLAVQARGAQEPAEAVLIAVGTTGEDTFYEYRGKRTPLSKCDSLAAFVAAVAAIVRQQAPHFRTYDAKTEYK